MVLQRWGDKKKKLLYWNGTDLHYSQICGVLAVNYVNALHATGEGLYLYPASLKIMSLMNPF